MKHENPETKLIREQDLTIKKLQKERDVFSFSRREITSQWMDVLLEEAQGLIQKLTAQVNHNYENSSMPSSKCTGRKKITNNREKTGKKPGHRQGIPIIRANL